MKLEIRLVALTQQRHVLHVSLSRLLLTCFAGLQKCLARPSSLLGAVMQGLIIKSMKELLKDYLMWKDNKDDGYIYDEIHEFCSRASRSQLTELFEQLEEIITKADKYDSLCK